jgi:glycosyltransferase involved in cell wall biosynthesis
MKFSIVTPNFNGEKFLEEALRSVLAQRAEGLDVEYIVVDGGSTDGSMDIVERYRSGISTVISEKDDGPADAISKGLSRATGDVLAWLNSDDYYYPGALARVAEAMESSPGSTLCFGHCPIVDEGGREIRKGITRFKELFYPVASRFVVQSINFLSQPATFFRRSAWEEVGPLRRDFVAAWDYDFLLKVWKQGGAVKVPNPPLAVFRWHDASISGRHYVVQFREDWEAAADDAGRYTPQSLIHLGVRWGIVTAYSFMALARSLRGKGRAD